MSEGHDESNDYRVERKGSVWVFTINRAEQRNSLTWPIRFALLRTVGEAEADPDCGALIVTGAGDKAFCSGGDLRAKALASADQWPRDPMGRLRSIGEIVRCISTSPIVVISAVNGAAFGGGCFLALAADIVVAHERARFGFGFSKRGLVPDWAGFFILPRLVGMARAKNLVLRGLTLDAQAALQMGLIAEVVQTDVLAHALEIGREIGSGARVASAVSKQVLAKSFETGLDGMLTYELLGQTIAIGTDDHREGVQSFLEKRPAVFKGK